MPKDHSLIQTEHIMIGVAEYQNTISFGTLWENSWMSSLRITIGVEGIDGIK